MAKKVKEEKCSNTVVFQVFLTQNFFVRKSRKIQDLIGGAIIRRFENNNAAELADVITKTLRITNSKDYSSEYIENDIRFLTAEKLIERSEWTNLYVVCEESRIIGCGAIGSYWGKEDESSLFTVFVLPEYQGKGIGRKIIETLEKDEYFWRAKRIEIPSSENAVEFYRKIGYDYKNGIAEADDEQLYRLEKFR